MNNRSNAFCFYQYALDYNYRPRGQERLCGNLCLYQGLKQQLKYENYVTIFSLSCPLPPPQSFMTVQRTQKIWHLAECLGCSFPYSGSEWGQGCRSQKIKINYIYFLQCFLELWSMYVIKYGNNQAGHYVKQTFIYIYIYIYIYI